MDRTKKKLSDKKRIEKSSIRLPAQHANENHENPGKDQAIKRYCDDQNKTLIVTSTYPFKSLSSKRYLTVCAI